MLVKCPALQSMKFCHNFIEAIGHCIPTALTRASLGKCEDKIPNYTGGIVLGSRERIGCIQTSFMTIEELRTLDERYRQEKPNLFQLATPDQPASEAQLSEVERAIGARLPQTYRAFLREFGGGSYGLATIFSADPNSEWYLLLKQREASGYLPEGLLAFSDDFAGGNYILKVLNGQAQEAVFYWNQDGGESSTEFNDVFEFVARYAYEPA